MRRDTTFRVAIGVVSLFLSLTKKKVRTTIPRMQLRNIMAVPVRLVFIIKKGWAAGIYYQLVAILLVLYH